MTRSPLCWKSFRAVRVLLVLGLAAPLFGARPAKTWGPKAFSPLTAERIAALPDADRAPWQIYWEKSAQQLATLKDRPRPDASSTTKSDAAPKGGAHIRGLSLKEMPEWYAGDEARTVADHVVAAQSPFGGWGKGNDYHRAPDAANTEHGGWAVGTFDNDATTSEMRFLARVIDACGSAAKPAWRAAFARGLEYISAAQYPNGGFPQIYPLIGGYHDGVTFNDDAMVHVLTLLREVARGRAPYTFVEPKQRIAAEVAFKRGVRCILAAQLRGPDGALTVWCQQYDPLTLRAAAARNFEPIADCARESVEIVELLMKLRDPSPEVVAAVDGAVAWFRKTALHDLRIARAPADLRGEAVPSPGAPPLWARFYEPGTTTPIFGDRDRTIHYDLKEISGERIRGYGWYTEAPSAVLEAYPAWKATTGK